MIFLLVARLAAWVAVFAISAIPFSLHAQTTVRCPTSLQKKQHSANKTPLSANIHIIQAEVARTEKARQQGLMHRQCLDDNEGMLFAFDNPDHQCFWMRNTPLSLSIAFIADDGTIVNIEDMVPNTDDRHCSRKAVRYALEVKQGWFARHGISVGQKIEGLP